MNDDVPRHRGVLPALALLAVLAVLAGVLVYRGARRDAGPGGPVATPRGDEPSIPAPVVPADGLDRAALVRALGPPEDDLPPDRFSERVDGADRALRRAGCVAIVAWRLGEPVPADLELYVFRGPGPARAFLVDRGMPRGTDRAAADGLAFLRVGRCAILGIPDDPGEAEALARDRFPSVTSVLAAAGCGEDAP